MPFLHPPQKREIKKKWAEEQTFRTGFRHKIFYPEGGYYKCNWLNGYQSGKGIEIQSSNLKYEGDWELNKKHGHGVKSIYNQYEKIFKLMYRGDYRLNKMHGYGCLHYENGTFFEGEFKFDKKHGFGRCWFHNNSYYEGYWVKDLQQGYGMLVQANGNRYEGAWRLGKKDGWGVFYHLDRGQKQTGVWESDTCITSLIEDITYRQSAINQTPFPIQKLELDSKVQCLNFLERANEITHQYNEGCQLHKYCYKFSTPTSRKELIQDTECHEF